MSGMTGPDARPTQLFRIGKEESSRDDARQPAGPAADELCVHGCGREATIIHPDGDPYCAPCYHTMAGLEVEPHDCPTCSPAILPANERRGPEQVIYGYIHGAHNNRVAAYGALNTLVADLAEWMQAASDMNRELEEARAALAADLARAEARGDTEMERAESLRKRVIVAERALDAYDGKDELLDALARRVDLDELEARHAQTVEALDRFYTLAHDEGIRANRGESALSDLVLITGQQEAKWRNALEMIAATSPPGEFAGDLARAALAADPKQEREA